MPLDGKPTKPASIPFHKEEESFVGSSGPASPSGTIREVTSGARNVDGSQQPAAPLPPPTGAASGRPSHTIQSIDNACSVLGRVFGVGGMRPDGARTERGSALHHVLGLGRRVGGANRGCLLYGLVRLGRGATGDLVIKVWVGAKSEQVVLGQLGELSPPLLLDLNGVREFRVVPKTKPANFHAKTQIALSNLELALKKSHPTTTEIDRIFLVSDKDMKRLRFNGFSLAL